MTKLPLRAGWFAWGVPGLLIDTLLVLFFLVLAADGCAPPPSWLFAFHLGPFVLLMRDDLSWREVSSDGPMFAALVTLPLITMPTFLWWRTTLGAVISAVGTVLWFLAGIVLLLWGLSA